MTRLPSSLSEDSIRLVWKDSRDSKRNAGAAGVDRISAEKFKQELRDNICAIQKDVRDGAFRFRSLRAAPVLKPTGNYRILAIPTVRDRLVQRCLIRHLENDPRFNGTSSISYGFSRGRSLQAAQTHACEIREHRPWVAQADIIKFFDRIPRLEIKKLVQKKVRSAVVRDLLFQAINCELEDWGGKAAQIAKENGIQKGVGLRQGMPASPMLSNLLLKSFDDALAKKGITAIRYADDLAIFGETKAECEEALVFIRDALKRLELEIPELGPKSKTKVCGPSESVTFLGVDIKRDNKGYKLCAPFEKIDEISRKMASIANMQRCISNKINIGRVVLNLESFVIGHSASMAVLGEVEQENFESRLRAKAQKNIESLLIEIIGKKAVAQLDDDRRALLGIQLFK